ncbi:MFS transporter [Sphingobacterium sp. SRCM116780]|uniref:MFS transporter n=1 Tax=Sphingobacterium sp. SRCM116780 TaxID=2907623 RepID=UPI001F25BA67|nr:MFS transporter [Sphingobacterium sp. SRCM116780]UIR56934.1 MFS transporter [Sphingobacterium sp. SRCM116780]
MEQENASFTGYQKLVIFLLAITQFTVILDFMVMSPMGDILMKSLSIEPKQFGFAVSAYAFSAGISGLLTAGFADKFDRKKLLLFFYIGFIVGTIFCGLAQSYVALITARIITGLFGGVIGSISMAIISDLFSLKKRGRVMGFVQMAFGASQVLGVPIGLYIANVWDWEAPFLMVAGLAVIIAIIITLKMRPVADHLKIQTDKSSILHLWHTLSKSEYRIGFATTALLSIGGFMMMPFGSVFAVNNLKITQEQLPILFMISGLSTLIILPLIGKLSDRVSKFKIFLFSSIWLMTICVVYTNLGQTAFWLVVIFNIFMMIGIVSRMVPSSALTSAIPNMEDRGAFMSINSSLQQIAGGIAASVAGFIVVQKTKFSPLEHYDRVAYVIVVISILSLFLMYHVDRYVTKKTAA